MTILTIGVLVVLSLTLLYRGRAYWAWLIPGGLALVGWWLDGVSSPTPFRVVVGVFAGLAVVFGVPALRRALVSRWVIRLMGPLLPRIGATERIALDAGTVWWDRDLFSGKPDWQKLLAFTPRGLSEQERAFLDGPVEELCAMLNEWEIVGARDLPPRVWDFIKQHRFFGMIIPEEYGGLGFSAAGHSAVVVKVASRSVTAAVTVMAPNSLGPAELLLHYGTEEQKRQYLPRLATGVEVPCFALTGPEAGSDAAATQSEGIVCHGIFRGKDVLGMRLNWRKRYITLGPVATVIGLAFRLRDPDQLLGEKDDLGITCALIPSDLPGIEIGARHDPMGVPIQNGPNCGQDVFVPLDYIIGGREMAGHGWRMLMESLAAGRSISLPALAVASAEVATRVVGAYATVREQFDTPIGRFEGIEEPLARIGGMTYLMNAARTLTAGAVGCGGAARGALGHREGVPDRGDAPGGERRDGHPGRRGDLPRATQHPRACVSGGTDRDHRRGSQYPDPLHDHLWTGGDPEPSLRPGRDAGRRGARSRPIRPRLLRSRRPHRDEHGARVPARSNERSAAPTAGERDAPDPRSDYQRGSRRPPPKPPSPGPGRGARGRASFTASRRPWNSV